MATRIFDRDTLLDLTVNIIPLVIIAFFVVAFVLVNPWGVDPLASGIQFALLIAPFVLLAVLTYISGKAIAGDEKRAPVFVPGQATVRGAKPLEGHGHGDEAEGEDDHEGEAAGTPDGDDRGASGNDGEAGSDPNPGSGSRPEGTSDDAGDAGGETAS
jgi:hypothetical protein